MKRSHRIYIVADQLRYDMPGKGFVPHCKERYVELITWGKNCTVREGINYE